MYRLQGWGGFASIPRPPSPLNSIPEDSILETDLRLVPAINNCSTCYTIQTDSVLPQFCTEKCTNDRWTCAPCAPVTETSTSFTSSSRLACNECHAIRHKNNLAPTDIVYGLCGGKCDSKEERILTSKLESNTTAPHFTLRAVVNGVLVRVLVDMGATTEFISSAIIDRHEDLQNAVTLFFRLAMHLSCAPKRQSCQSRHLVLLHCIRQRVQQGRGH